MKLLLDTHVFLWLNVTPERLGLDLALVEASDHELLVSAATSWELAIKAQLGKLRLPEEVVDYVPSRTRAMAGTLLPITHAHAAAVATLPPIHRDPFDRLLVAQAQAEGATLLTADVQLAGYGDAVRLLGNAG